jgi:GTPase
VKLAIVGRPNTGKSSLFNRLAGKNKAVTDDVPGVTRDRLYVEADFYGKKVVLIDTGGYEFEGEEISKHIVRQIHMALDEADAVLFVVDGKEGLNPADKDVANILRKSEKPVVLVINKIDHDKLNYDEFHSIGIKDMIPVSSAHALGIGNLVDRVLEIMEEQKIVRPSSISDETDLPIKLAIAGRPNTGKSTMLNSMIGEQRAVTSDIPGTTRDVIDIELKNKFGDFIIMDTAGIRRHAKTSSKIEVYSIFRSKEVIKFSDVCLLMIDGVEGFTHQDKKVSQIISEAGVACVVVINKRDLMKKEFTKDELYSQIPYLDYAPVVYVSALFDKDFSKVFKTVSKVYAERKKNISTADLNRFLKSALNYKTPPLISGKEVKLKYIVQASKEKGGVPRFIIYGKNAKLTHSSYRRYLVAKLREEYGFIGNPVDIVFKEER